LLASFQQDKLGILVGHMVVRVAAEVVEGPDDVERFPGGNGYYRVVDSEFTQTTRRQTSLSTLTTNAR
jgi:hypothetical protein